MKITIESTDEEQREVSFGEMISWSGVYIHHNYRFHRFVVLLGGGVIDVNTEDFNEMKTINTNTTGWSAYRFIRIGGPATINFEEQ